jgi:hypothetical protein
LQTRRDFATSMSRIAISRSSIPAVSAGASVAIVLVMRIVLLVVALATASSTAHADCAAAPQYDAVVGAASASTVSVSIDQAEPDQTCGGSTPMLRQNIDTGEVVQLATYCDQDTYLDECVPAGRYRYGLAMALACEGCGGTAFFTVADVTASSDGCTLSSGDAGATAYAGDVPWSSPTGASATESIDYVCTNGPGCSAGGKLRVHVFDSLALLVAIAWSIRRRRSR